MRLGLVIVFLMLSSGCQSLQQSAQRHGYWQPDCRIDQTGLYLAAHPCDIVNWLAYWQDHAQLDWAERREMMAKLGDSDAQKLQKVLLSQPIDTPYQARLRAQFWLQDIQPAMPDKLRSLVNLVIEKPGQKLLEYESAVVLLSEVNTQQQQTIEDQKVKIQTLQQSLQQSNDNVDKLEQQLQQLLNLESDLQQGSN